MPTWYVVLLAVIQAITEFMPISSSGHLGLVGFFFGLPYQGLTFDLALHLGTLFAIVAYFWRDLLLLARATLALRSLGAATPIQRMGIGIVLSTIPGAIVGASMPDAFTESLRAPVLIAINLIVFGILLGLADLKGRKTREAVSLTYRDALLIGAAQALALIPGTSRSGVTLTAGLALGMTRDAAARYSFLMAVPITALACAHGAWSFVRADEAFDARAMVLGIVVSALAGIAVIHFLLAILRRLGTAPFVVYRLALGVVVLAMVALGAP
ncbi:MAG TPA: undecaprenyl-diphosphate phosphatase [Xanthomonadales bacterium]|nr:undecaprenyl-diphosphate phosphatase [Xanthomonadales bacterium]